MYTTKDYAIASGISIDTARKRVDSLRAEDSMSEHFEKVGNKWVFDQVAYDQLMKLNSGLPKHDAVTVADLERLFTCMDELKAENKELRERLAVVEKRKPRFFGWAKIK